MARWQPDAAARLRDAARELFSEQGYDATTVADIAERAGLTPRTFFRYFPDKREVLFSGSEQLLEQLAAAAASASGSTWDAVSAALTRVADLIGSDREWSVRRQGWLEADADLHGRELTKLATMGRVLAEALEGRGVPRVDAQLAAEVGMVAFRTAYATWISDESQYPLAIEVTRTLDRLRVL